MGGGEGRAPFLYETLLEVERLHFIIENLLICGYLLYILQSANLACGHCVEVNLTTDLNLVLGIEQVDLTTVLFTKCYKL